MSEQLMRFDPATGEERPYPSHAKQWREFKGDMAWLFDPWTGARRHASDVGSDLHGLLIVPDGEPLRAASEPATVAVDAGALIEQLRAAVIASQARIAELEQANNRVILDSSTVEVNREALEALREAFQKYDEIRDMVRRRKVSTVKRDMARGDVIHKAWLLIRGDE